MEMFAQEDRAEEEEEDEADPVDTPLSLVIGHLVALFNSDRVATLN